MTSTIRFVALSDTHNLHDYVELPDGDVLLFGGDMCGRGNLEEVRRFGAFLARQPHPHKVVIAGNHDWPFELGLRESIEALGEGITYLQDEMAEIEGFKIYGSPWQPEFFQWAFNLPRGQALQEVWERIPEDTDILITHGPPSGILDTTFRGQSVGCEDLRQRVSRLAKLKVHVFGHIHEAYGHVRIGDVSFYNASICALSQREATNPPWIFDLKRSG